MCACSDLTVNFEYQMGSYRDAQQKRQLSPEAAQKIPTRCQGKNIHNENGNRLPRKFPAVI